MKFKKIYSFLLALGAISAISCERLDDEPELPSNPISRLYVSLFEVQLDETKDPYQNLVVIDPSDSPNPNILYFNSSMNGGGSVLFDPVDGRIFQASTQDSSIQIMSVSEIGIPSQTGRISSGPLTGIRDVQYDATHKYLFVTNTVSPSGLYIFDKPLNRNGVIPPYRKYELGGDRPWGMHHWNDSLLLMTVGGENSTLRLYTQLRNNIENDQTVDLTPKFQVTLAFGTGLRGMDYSPKLDVLAIADVENSRILIFENVRAKLQSSSNIGEADRVIQGALTLLSSPIDVAIDDRENSLKVYAADRLSKSVHRYDLESNGNTAPEQSFKFNLTPESIFLDARGIK